jgi:FkbM family methyltransferase
MTDATQHPPFGTYSLPRSHEWLRQQANRLPNGRAGRAGASLIRRFFTRRGLEAYDVEVFPSIRARLYPATNRCEKRVLAAAQFFDAQERAFLDRAVASSASNPFVFVDLGANVGLYSLSVLASARRHNRNAKLMAVEPDPVTRSRLLQNIAFSDANDQFIIEACGVGATRGTAAIVGHANNRGEHRLVTDTSNGAGAPIDVLPLLDICHRHGITTIEALKIDVEGLDYDVLAAFFATAPKSLRPGHLIVEVGKTDANPAVVALCEKHGYHAIKRTKLNVILSRAESGTGHH